MFVLVCRSLQSILQVLHTISLSASSILWPQAEKASTYSETLAAQCSSCISISWSPVLRQSLVLSCFIMFYHVLSHFIILNHIVSQSATWTVLEHSTVYFLSILCSYSRLLVRECTCFLRSMKSDSPLQSQSWLALPCPEFCGSGCTLGCFEHVPTCSNCMRPPALCGSNEETDPRDHW